MPNTFTLIQAVTVGSGGSAAIDFTSIPGTYTDLVLHTSIRQSNVSTFSTLQLTINSSTSTFTNKILEADTAGSPSSGTSPARYVGYLNASTSTANTFGVASIYLPNYAGSNNKSYSIDYTAENNATSSYLGFVAGLWSTTSAITAISLVPSTGTILQYSTAYLYGIVSS
jgi:hypothetical protein